MTGASTAGRRRRRFAAAMVAGLLGVATILWLLWRIALPEAVERWAVAALEAAGFRVERLEVASVSASGTRIEDIVLSGLGTLRIGTVEIDYDIRDLPQGRVDAVRVSGASLTLVVDEDGRIVGGGLPATSGVAEGDRWVLPLDRISVRDSRVRIDTPWLDADVPVTATAEVRLDGSLSIRGKADPATHLGEAALRFAAIMDEAGRLTADIDVSAERFGDTVSVRRLTGWLAVEGGSSGPPTVDAQFTAARLETSVATLSDVVLQFGFAGRGAAWALLRAGYSGSGGALRLDAALKNDAVDLAVSAEADDLASLVGAALPPGIVSGAGEVLLSGRVELDPLLNGHRLVLSGTAPWRASATIAGLGPSRVEMPGPDQRLVLGWGEGTHLSLEGGYVADAGPAAMHGSIDFTIAEAAGLMEIAIDRATATGMLGVADSPGVAIEGLTLTGRGTTDLFEGRVEGTVSPDGDSTGGRPPAVIPLRLSGNVRASGNGLTVTGRGVGGQGAVMLDIDLRHDFGDGGEVTVGLDPVSFAPGVRQPADVFPILAALGLDAVAGTVSGTGRYGWGDAAGSEAEVVLEDLSFETPHMVVSGASATLRADSLQPLILPPGQRVSVAGLDIGIPLANGVATFGVPAADRLSVASLSFDWAGGRLWAEPFALFLSDPEHVVVLRAEDIGLARLAAAMPVDGLEVTGRLFGRIPIRLGNDTIVIDGAVLRTAGPGVIRYVPDAPQRLDQAGDDSLNLLLQALRNFHYESVTLTLDGETGEDMTARLEIRGANPDLYDGYPIALNVNVSGALDEILSQGLTSARYGERIEEIYRERLGDDMTGDFLDDIEDIQQ